MNEQQHRGPPLAEFLATGMWVGRSPFAPGTLGSLAFLLLWYLGALYQAPVWARVATAILVSLVGLWACEVVLRSQSTTASDSDPQRFVIDEWAGMAFALAPVASNNWILLLIAFVAFRTLDITKPGPVGAAESLPRAWGIMADDIIAGLIAAGVVLLIGDSLPFLWHNG